MVELARPHAARSGDPDLPHGHMAMGYIRRVEGAAALLAEISAAAPPDSTDPLIMRWAGWSYLTQGRPELALDILERAQRASARLRIGSSLVDCYLMLGRREDEQRMLATMREVLVNKASPAIQERGRAGHPGDRARAVGRTEAGIAQAERAVAEEPEDGRVRYNAACVRPRGKPERAIERLRAPVGLVPSLTDWVSRDPDFASLSIPTSCDCSARA